MPNERKVIRSNSFQDFLFLIGTIVFSSILIIGLFPGRSAAGLIDENFFITTVMTIPIISGIYFIIISFRRGLNIHSTDIRESLKKKIILSFVFIAVLSAMPIVIISNTYFNQNLSRMFRGSTLEALHSSTELVYDSYLSLSNDVERELNWIHFYIENNGSRSSKDLLSKRVEFPIDREFNFFIFNRDNPVFIEKNRSSSLSAGLFQFYKDIATDNIRIDRISIGLDDLIVGAFQYKKDIFVLSRSIPQLLREREMLFARAYNEYMEVQNLKDYFTSGSGSFLMLLSILIVGIAYLISLYMSGSITLPILELVRASREVARGNYEISVKLKSNDEIGELVNSFNLMASDLLENQKMMFQKQRLEAWNDMAKKLVHEIKNPLTPIRLSVERMRKLVREGSPARDAAVIEGTETVLNEVNALLALVGEFNDFARLPEKKAELSDINFLIQQVASLFSVHKNIVIIQNLEENLPRIMMDRLLMRQVLNNLMTNAVQAMKYNGQLIITTKSDSLADFIWITISDDGPGISSEDFDKIFEPGFTLKRTGSGLGLAIVEKIILEHNGKIFCSSVLGEGAEFIIGLPFYRESLDG